MEEEVQIYTVFSNNLNVTPGGKSVYDVGHPLAHDGPTGSTHFNSMTEDKICFRFDND